MICDYFYFNDYCLSLFSVLKCLTSLYFFNAINNQKIYIVLQKKKLLLLLLWNDEKNYNPQCRNVRIQEYEHVLFFMV